jgi:hypothetical protein
MAGGLILAAHVGIIDVAYTEMAVKRYQEFAIADRKIARHADSFAGSSSRRPALPGSATAPPPLLLPYEGGL